MQNWERRETTTWFASGLVFSSPLSAFVRPSSYVLVFSLPSGSPSVGACWRWRSGSDYVWIFLSVFVSLSFLCIFISMKIFIVEKMKEHFPCSLRFSLLSLSLFSFIFLLPPPYLFCRSCLQKMEQIPKGSPCLFLLLIILRKLNILHCLLLLSTIRLLHLLYSLFCLCVFFLSLFFFVFLCLPRIACLFLVFLLQFSFIFLPPLF